MFHPYQYGFRPEPTAANAVFGILMMVFWVAVIVGVVVFVSHYAKQHNHGNNKDTAEDPLKIAKARYAKGEINKDEYIQLKKDLTE